MRTQEQWRLITPGSGTLGGYRDATAFSGSWHIDAFEFYACLAAVVPSLFRRRASRLVHPPGLAEMGMAG